MTTDSPMRFEDVLAHLARDGVRAVVVGGVAVVLHGHERPIADLDLVVGSDPVAAQRAMRSLAQTGFVSSLPLPLVAVTMLRLFDVGMREVDVFARYPVPFADLDREAVDARVGTTPVRIASLAHLLMAKAVLGREHDLADIEAFARMGRGAV